jgi:protein TonB
MLADVPQVVTPQSFVQPIEPPPPDVTDLAKHIIKIPVNRTSFGGITVVDISQLDQVPVPKFRVRPIYPFTMINAGESGEVLVDFIVDTDGNVRNPTAVKSSRREFEDNAVTAVGRWKFIPGRKNNHTVYTHMQVPIRFALHKQDEEQ